MMYEKNDIAGSGADPSGWMHTGTGGGRYGIQ